MCCGLFPQASRMDAPLVCGQATVINCCLSNNRAEAHSAKHTGAVHGFFDSIHPADDDANRP